MVTASIHQLVDLKARAIVQARQKREESKPTTWRDWIAANFSGYLWPPYAPYHEEFWDWAWAIQPGESAPPFVAIWPRGFAKSTSTEVACALMAGEEKRRYGLYVCATQDRADDHVLNVAGLLESKAFSQHYPQASQRKIGKYGNSQGWRRNRLRTLSGFTLDAIGLDTAARGAKIDEDRPDWIIFDDVDGVLDSPGTTAKKLTMITQSILPARAQHAVVLVAQNLIHPDGIVAQLADGRAEFLADRVVSGPHPAIENLVIETVDGKRTITSGKPTWPAMTIPTLQKELDEIGETAFKREKQNDVDHIEGSMFEHLDYRHCEHKQLPPLDRIVVWVDPAVTDTERSDSHGIQADGIARDRTIYRLYSWEGRTSPEDSMRRAILKAIDLKAECVGVETDQGGDTWRSTYNATWDALVASGAIPKGTRKPTFREEKAGGIGPKSERAGQMLAAYERGEIVHVIGTHETLERALKRYLVRKPYDLVDAAYWSWHDIAKPPSKAWSFG